jgi:hypothetical protein
VIEWILILTMYAGTMSKSDSVALTNVPGFTNQAECEIAGRTAVKEFDTLLKSIKFVCVQITRRKL